MSLPRPGRYAPAFAVVLLIAVFQEMAAQPSPYTYRVNLPEDDPILIVRSEPAETSKEVVRLKNNTRGIRITGRIVMNGPHDWIPILVNGKRGWVRPKYLALIDQAEAATLSTERPSNDRTEDAGISLSPVTRQRTAESNDLPLGWIVIGLVFLAALGKLKKGGKKTLGPNECPKCHHNTLETRSGFFGGSYRRCTRWFCDYNEKRLREEQNKAHWRAVDEAKQARMDSERANIVYERQRQKEWEERK